MASPLDRLDLVFLAWRESPAMLERHHAAVAAALPEGWAGSAVLVENAPSARTRDAAEELVAFSYPSARRVALRLPGNWGFGRAMDLALDTCRGEYVCLVNSDGRPEPGMFERLVEVLDLHPDAVWAAPGVHGPGEPGHPPGPVHEEDELPGMALVIRRERFLALGGFDPLYFFYNEDFDASKRIRAAGGRLLRAPDVRFHHGKGGRSRRGQLIRELYYALTDQTLVLHHDPSVPSAARRIARGRSRSLGGHARSGSWPAVLALAAATLALPWTSARALGRRRRPWTGDRLATWLVERRPQVAQLPLEVARPSSASEAAVLLAATDRAAAEAGRG